MQRAFLQNWYLSLDKNMAWGRVFGHPMFPDGLFVHTSRITSIDTVGTQKTITTLNTIYVLGDEYVNHGEDDNS